MKTINFSLENNDLIISLGSEDERFQYLYLTLTNYFKSIVPSEKITIIKNFSVLDKKNVSNLRDLLSVLDKKIYTININSELQSALDVLNKDILDLEELRDKIRHLKKLPILEGINTFKSEISKNLIINLRDYQVRASYFLTLIKSGFDFSVPGAGKTIISYVFYHYLIKNNEINCLFVVGPKSASNAWLEEYKTCFGVEPDLEDLSNKESKLVRAYLLSSKQNHKQITFINFDKFRLLNNEISYYMKNKKVLLIVDEAHKVKNPNAKVTKTALSLANFAKYRLLLTGTPMPNGYEDLYSLCKIAYPSLDILPFSYGELKTYSKNGVSQDKEKMIINSINSFYSRVSKKYLLSIGELKEPFFYYSTVEMNEKQKKIYDFLDNIFVNIENKVDQTLRIVLMKAILIRKMQTSSNPILLKKTLIDSFDEIASELLPEVENDNEIDPDKLKKMKIQLEVVEKYINQELYKSNIAVLIDDFNNNKMVNKNISAVTLAMKLVSENKKVVLWDTFVSNMIALKSLLSEFGLESQVINGQVTGEERKKIIENFRNGDLNVLIASPATLSESISLHRACQNSIYVNRNFNAAQFIQSKDRIHRINMPVDTTASYYFLSNESTIDIDISESLEKKEQRMLKILDSEEIVPKGDLNAVDLSGLTNEEIISYFAKK